MTSGPTDDREGAAEPVAESSDAGSAVRSTLLADAIGGPRGMLDTGVPAIVFIIVNAASSLTMAILAALGVGVLLVVVRVARRQTIQQALAGFIGVGIAAFVASRTHSAEGFFLPGILYQAALAIAAAVSLVVRRPLIGYVMAALDPHYVGWRDKPGLVHAMDLATVVWGTVFLLRAVVQGLLYLAHHAGWLAVVQISMGWPLFAAALAISYALARRAHPGTTSAPSDGSADGSVDDAAAPEQVNC